MRAVGLFEAKQKLGDLTAVLVPAPPVTSLRDVFQDIERIRKRVKPTRSGDVKERIEDGRT